MQFKKRQKVRTEASIEPKALERALRIASEQRMLPTILWQFSQKHKSSKFMSQYQNSVKKLYTEKTAKPLQYNENDSKSECEKFRQKILKLISHQIPIDYLQTKTIDQQVMMTYKGEPLDKIKYQTQKQYQIFKDFSETKFKKGFNDLFDDGLEYQHKKLLKCFQVQKERKKFVGTSSIRENQVNEANKGTEATRATEGSSAAQSSQKPEYVSLKKQVRKQKEKSLTLPKLINRLHVEHSKLSSPLTLRKRKLKKQITMDEQSAIIQTMKKIGSYSKQIQIQNLSLTKESIIKYLKQYYNRPQRIVDFLHIQVVETVNSFMKAVKRLKLMPNDHINFMAFLFYDQNSDGYICHQDLIKAEQLTKKCGLIRSDIERMKIAARKVEFEDVLPYKQLYRCAQLTETKYFEWKGTHCNMNPEQDEKPPDPQKSQMKQCFRYVNRNKMFIHFEGFKDIFRDQKPYIWYDLLWRIGGIVYEGLRYT